MKKILLIVLLAPVFALKGFSQNENDQQKGGQKLEALKIAWLTKKLDLSPEEAQRFWPIYNKYTEEIRGIRLEQRQKNSTEIDTEDKILGVRKKYNGEFSKALPVEKVNTFFKVEKDFGN